MLVCEQLKMDCLGILTLGVLYAHLCIEGSEHIQEEAIFRNLLRTCCLWQYTWHHLWAARWVCSGLEDAWPWLGWAVLKDQQGKHWSAREWYYTTDSYKSVALTWGFAIEGCPLGGRHKEWSGTPANTCVAVNAINNTLIECYELQYKITLVRFPVTLFWSIKVSQTILHNICKT